MSEKNVRNIALITLLAIVWYLTDFKTAIYALIGGMIAGYFGLFIYSIILKIIDR